jgi:hypothetical protein
MLLQTNDQHFRFAPEMPDFARTAEPAPELVADNRPGGFPPALQTGTGA